MDAVSDVTRRAARAGTALFAAALAAILLAPAPTPAQDVPTPESVIGFELGSDYRLADHDQLTEYYRQLDAASDRMMLREVGTSVQGRTMYVAYVSSRENLQNLERYREISRRLARAEVDSAEARRLSRQGKAFVWIDAGLHSTEVSPSQAMPRTAYRLVTSDDPEVRKIRENTIVMLMPVMNPDGLDIVVDWYREQKGTRFETASLPTLYHEYTGHDNNRDWFMLLMPESQAVAQQIWHRNYPQIVYNHHQAGEPPPAIVIPPFADPMNPNIPDRVTTGVNTIGSAIAQRMAKKDMPGVESRETYTMWWNGGMRTAPYFHNQMGILSEVMSTAYATPREYDPEEFPESMRRPSVMHANPWEGGWWRLSDQVAYDRVASMAVAEVGADMKEKWLFGNWQMANRAVQKGESGDPYAWVIPAAQWDEGAAHELVSVLRRNGVEVHRATGSFRAGGRQYDRGTYIAYAGQAYRQVLMDLMEPQDYPTQRQYPGGPIETPYDLAGWTLPMQMGVDVDRPGDPFEAPTEVVEAVDVSPSPSAVSGSGPVHLITTKRNDAFGAVNRLLADGAEVSRAAGSFRAAGRDWSAGTFLVRGDRDRLEEVASESGLEVVGVGQGPDVETLSLSAPRVGLYRSWDPSMDEGWTRWIFEQWDFQFETVRDADLRGGDLSSFDVIVFPRQDADDILHGNAPGTMPEKYVGGVGVEGTANLKRWVENGGTLVTLDRASEYATRVLGVPVENAVAGVPRQEFFIPGSLIRTEVDTSDPLAWGMQDTAAAYYVQSLAFDPVPVASEPNGAEGPKTASRQMDVAVRYAGDDLLMSGWENGAREQLGGEAAMVRVPMGEGTVVLTGFRAQFRAQPRGTFKLFFNALYSSTTQGLPFESTHAGEMAVGGSSGSGSVEAVAAGAN